MSRFMQVFWLVWGICGIFIAGFGFIVSGIHWQYVFCMAVSVVLTGMMIAQLVSEE